MILAKKAVIFDLDGTLVDSSADLAASGNWLRQREGLPLLPESAIAAFVREGGMRGGIWQAVEAEEGIEEPKQRRGGGWLQTAGHSKAPITGRPSDAAGVRSLKHTSF